MVSPTQAEIADLVARIKRMHVPYLGDGINSGFTTTELLAALEPLLDPVSAPATVSRS